jgi:hypothetical protein
MHKSASYLNGSICSAERLNSSVNGNPRFRVIFLDESADFHTLITSSDSSASYDVENVQRSGELVTIGLTRAGRIETITRWS